MDDVYSIMI